MSAMLSCPDRQLMTPMRGKLTLYAPALETAVLAKSFVIQTNVIIYCNPPFVHFGR